MSKALVSIEEAEEHLRVSGDPSLSVYIEAASEVVLNYLGDDAAYLLDTAGEVERDTAGPIGVPFRIRAATLILISDLYDRRGAENPAWAEGDLPQIVKTLLGRRPVVA